MREMAGRVIEILLGGCACVVRSITSPLSAVEPLFTFSTFSSCGAGGFSSVVIVAGAGVLTSVASSIFSSNGVDGGSGMEGVEIGIFGASGVISEESICMLEEADT